MKKVFSISALDNEDRRLKVTGTSPVWLDRVIDALVFTFVASLPISIAMTQITLALAWAALGTRALVRREWPGHRSGLDWFFAIWLAACVMATFTSSDPVTSLVGLKKFYLISAAYLLYFTVRTLRRLIHLIWTYIGTVTLMAGYGLGLYSLGRQQALLGTQTLSLTTGGILMTTIALLFGYEIYRRPLQRAWWVCGALVAATSAALLLTRAFSGWIAAVASLAVAMALARRWKTLAGTLSISAALLALILWKPLPVFHRYQFSSGKLYSFELRANIWRTGWEMIKDKPVTGYGMISLHEHYGRKRDKLFGPGFDWNRTYGHLHNNILQVLVLTGFIGLTAFVMMFVAILKQSITAFRQAGPAIQPYLLGIVAAQSGFIVMGLAEYNFGDSEVVTIFWVLTGLSLAAQRISTNVPGDGSEGTCDS